MRVGAFRWLVCSLVVFGFVGGAFGQLGSIDPSYEELETLTPFVPAEIELIEQPAVDLRPWMPPVGMQRMNDCTAWAVAYGAKTYLEARDQGWKPDRPGRIFSPRYVYNQINKGEDKGSNFVQAIRVMMEQGCATLEACSCPRRKNGCARIRKIPTSSIIKRKYCV